RLFPRAGMGKLAGAITPGRSRRQPIHFAMNHLRFSAQARLQNSASRPSARRGFTLIEMMISLAVTLIMMGAVVTLFGTMTGSIAGSRALIETSDRLRALRNRLQLDLQGATARMQPPLRPEEDLGYFEVNEGQFTDSTYNSSGSSTGQLANGFVANA